MLHCPYFFFDVVYIHNGVEEKDDETSWKVKAGRGRHPHPGRCWVPCHPLPRVSPHPCP